MAAGAAVAAAMAAVVALPRARQEAPELPPVTQGWLVMAGAERLDGCGITRAYDLTTGRAFEHDACSGRAAAGTASVQRVRDAMAALLTREPALWVVGQAPAAHTWRWMATADRSLIGDLPASGGGEGLERLRASVATLASALSSSCRPGLPPPAQALVTTLPEMVNPVSADASQALTVRYRAAFEAWERMPACEGYHAGPDWARASVRPR